MEDQLTHLEVTGVHCTAAPVDAIGQRKGSRKPEILSEPNVYIRAFAALPFLFRPSHPNPGDTGNTLGATLLKCSNSAPLLCDSSHSMQMRRCGCEPGCEDTEMCILFDFHS